ncbi:hypothetical protein ABTY61_25485 [Kitasatospora sp. NPDC096128]|uniref:hypothetical protein n=1 Tax=Kitasatospora sp. NPDC096128 TaxID=3155547 RepID=UPI00332D63E4
MKIKPVLGILLAATVFTVPGCAGQSHVEASYAEHYDTVAELKTHSSLIVEVTAKDMSHIHREGGPAQGKSVLLTDSVVTVNRVLYDPEHQVTDTAGKLTAPTVVVYQTGGGAGTNTEISDDPIFKKEEHLVLFLRNGSEPGHFVVVGGPNGRFKTSNGKVEPFNSVSAKFTGAVDSLASSLASTSTRPHRGCPPQEHRRRWAPRRVHLSSGPPMSRRCGLPPHRPVAATNRRARRSDRR